MDHTVVLSESLIKCTYAVHVTRYEEFEDIKVVIRIRILKENRKHSGQRKKVQKDKQRSTKHTHKTKDRVTRDPLKSGMDSGAPLVAPFMLIL